MWTSTMSRMYLLFEKASVPMTAAEISRIMGETYDDVSEALAMLHFKHVIEKSETPNGWVYKICERQIPNWSEQWHD